jgi:hypothetical protein
MEILALVFDRSYSSLRAARGAEAAPRRLCRSREIGVFLRA